MNSRRKDRRLNSSLTTFKLIRNHFSCPGGLLPLQVHSFSPKLGSDLESGPAPNSGGGGAAPAAAASYSPRSAMCHMSPAALLPAVALNTAIAPASPAAVDHCTPGKSFPPPAEHQSVAANTECQPAAAATAFHTAAVSPLQPSVSPFQPAVSPFQPVVSPFQPAVTPFQPLALALAFQPTDTPYQPLTNTVPNGSTQKTDASLGSDEGSSINSGEIIYQC